MKVGTKLDRRGVLDVLPHREPFLFIDRVENILPGPNEGKPGNEAIIGRKIIAHFNATSELDFFKGHFPGRPIMPGVLLLETMAQAAAILAYDPEMHGPKLEVLLVSAKDARFKRPVVPPQDVRVEAVLTDIRKGFFQFDCMCFIGDQRICQSHLIASFGERL